jgi:hypothetical protein
MTRERVERAVLMKSEISTRVTVDAVGLVVTAMGMIQAGLEQMGQAWEPEGTGCRSAHK